MTIARFTAAKSSTTSTNFARRRSYRCSIPLSSRLFAFTRRPTNGPHLSSSTLNSKERRHTSKSPRRWSMPSAKRSPITYAPAFGGGIFRPKSAVDSDLALLDPEADADQSPDSAPEAPLESVSTVASSQPELPREKQPQKTRRTSKHSDASKLANTRASNPA